MTDKARELLKCLLENFERPVGGRFGDLFDEVRVYLAQPEVKREAAPKAMQKECPYAGGILRVSFYEGWIEAERHHGIGGVDND